MLRTSRRDIALSVIRMPIWSSFRRRYTISISVWNMSAAAVTTRAAAS